jgi:DNA-binding transcriptional LysR family regulator
MNTRFLETFVTLAQLRSFRATARALHATPAAISLRIKSLEDELQTELIDRNAKDFRLTAQAEYLLSHAKAVVDATRRLQSAARKDSAIRGRLRLGVIESVVHSWLAQYIRELNANYPELEIDLAVDMSNVLERRLRARELDLVIQVEGVDSIDIVSEALAIYPLHWIARKGLLDTRKEGLNQRLLQLPILTFGRGTAPQRALEEIVSKMANWNRRASPARRPWPPLCNWSRTAMASRRYRVYSSAIISTAANSSNCRYSLSRRPLSCRCVCIPMRRCWCTQRPMRPVLPARGIVRSLMRGISRRCAEYLDAIRSPVSFDHVMENRRWGRTVAPAPI